MDTTKWKSILVPREMYIDVKETAKREGRTISGQLCYAYEQFRGNPCRGPRIKPPNKPCLFQEYMRSLVVGVVADPAPVLKDPR
jgi:hypothetical protein